MDKNFVTRAGKKLSHALRHAPQEYNLSMDEFGVVAVDAVITNLGITLSELEFIVSTDNKTRFKFTPMNDGTPGIKASQGHTFPVEISRLPLTVTKGFHGTLARHEKSIMAKGLIPGKREFVHVSKTFATAQEVGLRWKFGDVIIFSVDVESLLKEQGDVFESENGVILTKNVPAKFLTVCDFITR